MNVTLLLKFACTLIVASVIVSIVKGATDEKDADSYGRTMDFFVLLVGMLISFRMDLKTKTDNDVRTEILNAQGQYYLLASIDTSLDRSLIKKALLSSRDYGRKYEIKSLQDAINTSVSECTDTTQQQTRASIVSTILASVAKVHTLRTRDTPVVISAAVNVVVFTFVAIVIPLYMSVIWNNTGAIVFTCIIVLIYAFIQYAIGVDNHLNSAELSSVYL